jgi:hypothetical protein
MAEYLVNDTDLTSVADSIRAKTGGTEQLVFPSGFKTAIEGIQTGSSATAPYIEETYDASGNLVDAKMHGQTSIRAYEFYQCSNLALISLPESITDIFSRAFYDCSKLALTSLPTNLTTIGEYAFYKCSNLTLTSLPTNLTSVGNYAFGNCIGLTQITFKGKPNSIYSNAFSGCTNLTTINVPWAEGAVANAPWGATNATINYNYTGE